MRGFLSRRFPSPWTSEQIPGGYVVKDAMSLAYVYAGETKAEADTAKVSRTSLARAYAIFGSSRQLIVGPDPATCAVIAAAVAPLAAGDEASLRLPIGDAGFAHGVDMYRRNATVIIHSENSRCRFKSWTRNQRYLHLDHAIL